MKALVRKAIWLSVFTVVYNILEGVVSIAFGVSEDSVALAGFGVDSLIEVASATLVLWRFRGESGVGTPLSVSKERKATLGIGILFLLLAVSTAAASLLQLVSHSHPETTLPGVIIAGASLSFMFWLWNAKRKLAQKLNSATVLADAQCSLACIKLSGVLLAGSLVFVVAPALWWIDSIAAMGIAYLIGKEGWETVQAAKHPEFSGGCGCSCGHKCE